MDASLCHKYRHNRHDRHGWVDGNSVLCLEAQQKGMIIKMEEIKSAKKSAYTELMNLIKKDSSNELSFNQRGMNFVDKEHFERYENVLSRMRRDDAYHKAAAYLMTLVPLQYADVFDFENDWIKHEGLFEPWQSHSSRKATRLMYNLWNGCYQDRAAEEPEKTSGYYAVDEIFSNWQYAPAFFEAIKIRFEWE